MKDDEEKSKRDAVPNKVRAQVVSAEPSFNCRAQASKRRLEWHGWLAAMDGYAVGVAVADAMAYHVALEHKAVLQEVATDASAEGKTADLGVFYDECARCTRVCLGDLFVRVSACQEALGTDVAETQQNLRC